MLAVLLALSLAHADPLLAPTLADVDDGLARVERLLTEASAEEQRLADAQLAWVEEGCPAACSTPRAVELAVASRGAGHAWRNALQSARAALARVQRMAAFEAVRPLIDRARRERLGAATAEVDRASRGYAVRVALQGRTVEPWAAAHEALLVGACREDD